MSTEDTTAPSSKDDHPAKHLSDLLGLVMGSDAPSPERCASRTLRERSAAAKWAVAVHCNASGDNGRLIPPKPAWLNETQTAEAEPNALKTYREEYDPNTGAAFAHPSTYRLVPMAPRTPEPAEPVPTHPFNPMHADCEPCAATHRELMAKHLGVGERAPTSDAPWIAEMRRIASDPTSPHVGVPRLQLLQLLDGQRSLGTRKYVETGVGTWAKCSVELDTVRCDDGSSAYFDGQQLVLECAVEGRLVQQAVPAAVIRDMLATTPVRSVSEAEAEDDDDDYTPRCILCRCTPERDPDNMLINGFDHCGGCFTRLVDAKIIDASGRFIAASVASVTQLGVVPTSPGREAEQRRAADPMKCPNCDVAMHLHAPSNMLRCDRCGGFADRLPAATNSDKEVQ
jgi:hypothetical protein